MLDFRHFTPPRPHDRTLLDVLRPNPRAPVADSEEVLGEARVPLQGVDGAVVGVVDGSDLLVSGLHLLVAREHAAWKGDSEVRWRSES